MFTRDDAKHPCTRLTCIRGFAVGHIERQGCIGRTANRCEYIGYVQGCYGETLVNMLRTLIIIPNYTDDYFPSR